MPYVKLSGTVNRHTDWTTEVILEKDDQGNPTKVVRAGEPVDLSADEQKKLEAVGYSFESSSKSEAEEFQQGGAGAPSDTSATAPVFGTSEKANQAGTQQQASTETSENDKSNDKK